MAIKIEFGKPIFIVDGIVSEEGKTEDLWVGVKYSQLEYKGNQINITTKLGLNLLYRREQVFAEYVIDEGRNYQVNEFHNPDIHLEEIMDMKRHCVKPFMVNNRRQ